MTPIQASQIAEDYGLETTPYRFNDTIHVHFMDGAGFWIATRRRKRDRTNSRSPLLSGMTTRKFRALCRKAQHHPKSEAEKEALEILKGFRSLIQHRTMSIQSAKYYPEFRLVTLMGDGFPMARFVLSEDFKSVFFAFSRDQTLQHMANPKGIPHIFPTSELTKWLQNVEI